jgi:hypothetical protein
MNILLRFLKKRMENNNSNLILVYGKKGKGKSFLSLRLSQLIDKRFTLSRCVFTLEDFFSLLDKGMPKGSCIVLDEIGVAANSRDSQTRESKHLSRIAQTIRPMGITVFATVPSWGLVDAQARNLMDYAIEAVGYRPDTETSTFKFFSIEPSNKPVPMRKHLVLPINNEFVKCMSWTCSMPSKDMATEYKIKRSDYSKQMSSDAYATSVSGNDIRYGKDRHAKKKPISIEEARKMIDDGNNIEKVRVDGKIKSELIKELTGCSGRKAETIASIYNKKELPPSRTASGSPNIINSMNQAR